MAKLFHVEQSKRQKRAPLFRKPHKSVYGSVRAFQNIEKQSKKQHTLFTFDAESDILF